MNAQLAKKVLVMFTKVVSPQLGLCAHRARERYSDFNGEISCEDAVK
jgi:hypothetical protein